MLKKVLFQNQDKTQLFIAVLGSVIGMIFLISSIHYLIRVNEFGKGEEILGPNTMIIQKKVSNSSSLKITKNDFSNEEIERFKNETFVADAQAVICNNFNVLLLTDDPLVPKFSSDVFLQTVNAKFLDVPSKKWTWKEGDTIVPIVMPRDFLVMLNTFMSASGIPQVSEDLAKDINFKLRISNETKKDFITARIVGFTNEIPSLLVPESFMRYANQKYATVKENKITNVMISSKNGEIPRRKRIGIKKVSSGYWEIKKYCEYFICRPFSYFRSYCCSFRFGINSIYAITYSQQSISNKNLAALGI